MFKKLMHKFKKRNSNEIFIRILNNGTETSNITVRDINGISIDRIESQELQEDVEEKDNKELDGYQIRAVYDEKNRPSFYSDTEDIELRWISDSGEPTSTILERYVLPSEMLETLSKYEIRINPILDLVMISRDGEDIFALSKTKREGYAIPTTQSFFRGSNDR